MSRVDNLRDKDRLVHSRTEESKEPRSFGGAYIFISVLLIAVLLYLLLFSGLLNVKNIEVAGYEHADSVKSIAREQIEENIFTKNILFFSTRKLRQTLLGDPNIKNIKVVKKFPNTIRIEVEESLPAIIWVSAGEKLLVDGGGVVMGPADDEKLNKIYDASNIKVKAGERVASPTFIKFISDITSGFESATGTKVAKITLFDLLEDVHVLSSSGWTVYFNASKSADAQLKNLARVLKAAGRDKAHLEYIDMRLDNKIFYK